MILPTKDGEGAGGVKLIATCLQKEIRVHPKGDEDGLELVNAHGMSPGRAAESRGLARFAVGVDFSRSRKAVRERG